MKSFESRFGEVQLSTSNRNRYKEMLDSCTKDLERNIVLVSKASSIYSGINTLYFEDLCKSTGIETKLYGLNCSQIDKGLLEQGLSDSIINVEQTIDRLSSETVGTGVDESTEDSLMYELMKVLVIQTSIYSFSEVYKIRVGDWFDSVLARSVLINLILLVILMVIFVGGWIAIFNKFQKRIITCKNVLSLLPAPMLKQNVRVNKYIQEVIQTINSDK